MVNTSLGKAPASQQGPNAGRWGYSSYKQKIQGKFCKNTIETRTIALGSMGPLRALVLKGTDPSASSASCILDYGENTSSDFHSRWGNGAHGFGKAGKGNGKTLLRDRRYSPWHRVGNGRRRGISQRVPPSGTRV